MRQGVGNRKQEIVRRAEWILSARLTIFGSYVRVNRHDHGCPILNRFLIQGWERNEPNPIPYSATPS